MKSPKMDPMLKSLINTIRRMFLALAGGLGGVVVGGLLSLMLFHLKVAHSVAISSFGLKLSLLFVASIVAGMIVPRFFMMFFLSPLSWLMDADASGGGHPSGDFEVTWPGFLFNAAYLVGLPLFVFGAIFSLPWLVGIGLSGILAFSFGVYRLSARSKDKPVVLGQPGNRSESKSEGSHKPQPESEGRSR